MRIALFFSPFVVLAACTQVPDVPAPEAAPATTAAYPDLVPLDPLLVGAETLPEAGTAQAAVLTARQKQLAARAAALN